MFLDLVKERQSCRSFLSQAVPRSLILQCLEAARLSPSACNSQPWHFIVVDEPALRQRLAEAVFGEPYAMNAHAKSAPVLIAVVREKSSWTASIGGFFRGTQYNLIDIGIAIEHFVLQAAELGLGTCWIGWFHEQKTKDILGIPRAKKVDCLISLGYPSPDESSREKIRKQAGDVYSFDRYHSHL
ncbi:MAG: nitroreductase family protein [Candidatus Omnitrophota bacterium]